MDVVCKGNHHINLSSKAVPKLTLARKGAEARGIQPRDTSQKQFTLYHCYISVSRQDGLQHINSLWFDC